MNKRLSKILGGIFSFFKAIGFFFYKISKGIWIFLRNFFLSAQKWNWKRIGLVAGILFIVYLLVGIGFAIPIYKYKAQNKTTNFAVKFYPYPAGTVGWNILYLKPIYERTIFLKNFSEKAKQPADVSQIRTKVFDEAADTEMIKTAARKNLVRVKKSDLNDAFNKIIQSNGGEDKVAQTLSDLYGMNVSDFKGLLRDQLLQEKTNQYVLKNVHARHILIKDQKKAQEILDRVKNGENFEELAKQFSEDQGSKDKGGDLDWFSRGQMVKEFEDAAFKTKKSEVYPDLVKTQYGFHIIKVEDIRGKVDQNFDDWLNELKKKTKVHKFYS